MKQKISPKRAQRKRPARRTAPAFCIDCGKPAEFSPPVCQVCLCIACVTVRIHSPVNVALMELDELFEEGGRLN
jgi:hypothetical protein